VFVARALAEAALRSGVGVVASELHGMAQRGGVVHSTVVFGGAHGAIVPPGEADLLVALEPLEAVRALVSLRRGGLAVVSVGPVVPFTVSQGGPPYPSVQESLARVRSWAAHLDARDFAQAAESAGERRAIGAAVAGAVAGLAALPVAAPCLREAVLALAPRARSEQNGAAFDAGLAGAPSRLAAT
jgi:indolepyruvate ferredoxin oxidoreductase beta subunit